MTTPRRPALFLVLLLTACATDDAGSSGASADGNSSDAGGDATGTDPCGELPRPDDDARLSCPPRISGLTYEPIEGEAGGNITITGQLSYFDRDGDVVSFSARVSSPSGTATIGPAAVESIGQPEDDVGFQLIVAAVVAGTYSFDVWVTDADGNDSNALTGSIEAN